MTIVYDIAFCFVLCVYFASIARWETTTMDDWKDEGKRQRMVRINWFMKFDAVLSFIGFVVFSLLYLLGVRF